MTRRKLRIECSTCHQEWERDHVKSCPGKPEYPVGLMEKCRECMGALSVVLFPPDWEMDVALMEKGAERIAALLESAWRKAEAREAALDALAESEERRNEIARERNTLRARCEGLEETEKWIKDHVGNIDFYVKVPEGVMATNPWIATGENFFDAIAKAWRELESALDAGGDDA